VVVFLITDFVRHKPVIIADGLLGIGIYAILIWGQGIPIMQVKIIQVVFIIPSLVQLRGKLNFYRSLITQLFFLGGSSDVRWLHGW
jgi:Reduced folate carrier